MNTSTKIITGTSVATLIILVVHLVHLAATVNDTEKNNRQENLLHDAPVTIITTDFSGKKDTLPLKEYMDTMKSP